MKKYFLVVLTALSSFSFCTTTTTDYNGIDVSHHQGKINWTEVAKNKNIEFVYIKATEGQTYKDPMFRYNASKATKAGVHVGFYHFFRMTSSAHLQFLNFKETIGEHNMDLIPMIDVETTDGHSVKETQDSLRVLLKLVEKEYGKKPMIYGTQRSYNTICAPAFNDYPLYIGRYGDYTPEIKGNAVYTVWQYTESLKLAGIKKEVDACKFHSSKGMKDLLM